MELDIKGKEAKVILVQGKKGVKELKKIISLNLSKIR